MEVPKSVLENLLGMQMAADPNLNFGAFPQPFCSQHVVSFQTSVTTSGSGGMPVYLDCSSGMDANMGMLSTTPSVAVSTSSSNMIADSGQNLKYGGPLAADWSYLELQVLKDGLEKYVNEQGIMKYINIATSLPTKTVRDVAMRCQWLGATSVMWGPTYVRRRHRLQTPTTGLDGAAGVANGQTAERVSASEQVAVSASCINTTTASEA